MVCAAGSFLPSMAHPFSTLPLSMPTPCQTSCSLLHTSSTLRHLSASAHVASSPGGSSFSPLPPPIYSISVPFFIPSQRALVSTNPGSMPYFALYLCVLLGRLLNLSEPVSL